MYPAFIQLETRLRMAEEWLAARDARRAAEKHGRSGPTTPRVPAALERVAAPDLAVTIRLSTAEDRDAILRLAALDGRQAPAGEMLLATVDGDLRAALPLAGGEAVADPFHPTAALVELLRVRDALLQGLDAGRSQGLGVRLLRSWGTILWSDVSGRGSIPGHPTYWPGR
jgi:hypothetical protein